MPTRPSAPAGSAGAHRVDRTRQPARVERRPRGWCELAMTAWSDARETLLPGVRSRDGLLPPLLLLLTMVTGLVDAASYLKLGHVFVANMTGNVVFIGFALSGAKGLSVPASLAAIGSFLTGGVAGGRLGGRTDDDRARTLA